MTAIIHRLDVHAANGIPFRVVYIPVGGSTVWTDTETHDLVEFFDLRYPHTPDGQFVSRYRVDTLLDDNTRNWPSGLNLDGGVPDWTIDVATMALVAGWLRSQRLLCHLPTPTT